MLPVKKIYIDSRMKTATSKSTSDFSVDLPVQLLMPENTVFYVDDVTIPVSWYNIGQHNRNLYVIFYVFSSATSKYVGYPKKIPLDLGNYNITTLAEALKQKLDFFLKDETDFTANTFSYTINTAKNNIEIKASNTMVAIKFLTDDAIGDTFVAEQTPYNSLNEVIGNFLPKPLTDNWTTGYINFQSIRNVYIRSPNLGSFSTMSLRGDRDIIKKVPVTANANEVIFNNTMISADYLECSRQTLSRLEFKLEDVNGNVIDLNGAHWSCSLIFSKYDTEI